MLKKTSEITGINRNTVNNYYKLLRLRIVDICENESSFPKGEFKIDESYFDPRRMKGKGVKGQQRKHQCLASSNEKMGGSTLR